MTHAPPDAASPLDPSRPPTECPECGKYLYASPRRRPDPALSAGGKLLMVLAVGATVVVYWGLGIAVRSYVFVPVVLLAPVLLLVALPVGIGIALLAHRLPKVLKLRCWKCGWRGRYRHAPPA